LGLPRAALGETLVHSGIDAAASTRHNLTHFTDADGRPISNVLSDDLETVRGRLRYETRNNGDGKGMVDTLANVVIGTGPVKNVEKNPKTFVQNPLRDVYIY